MGGPYKRKKYHNGDTHLKKGWRTKRRTKDLDEIDDDLEKPKALKPEDKEDKAGLGEFHCVHCDKHMIDANAFNAHVKGKPHKRRLNALKTQPYTIKEAEMVAGLGGGQQYQKDVLDKIAVKRKIETILPEAVKKAKTDDDD